jgi:hypothetical protein
VLLADCVLLFPIEELSYMDNGEKRVIDVSDISDLREELWGPVIEKTLTS